MYFAQVSALYNKEQAQAELKGLFSFKILSGIAVTYLLSIVWAYWVFYVNTWHPNVFIWFQWISFIPATYNGYDFYKGAMILKSKVNQP